jgi:signal transduction histidine kinase
VKRTARRAGLLLAALGLIPAPAAFAAASADTKNVLVLFSNSRLLPANVEAERAMRETLAKSTNRQVDLHAEFLDAPFFSGDNYAGTVAKYLREKYTQRPPQVIVAAAGDALEFILHYRATLFPEIPVVYTGVSTSGLRALAPLPADVVGVPVEYDFSGTIAQALKWRPRATRLVVVTGASAQDREWEERLREEAPSVAGPATPEFLAGLPTPAVLDRLRQLGVDAVVFTPGYFQDGDGKTFSPRGSAALCAAAATAPVYGPFNTFLGTGVVGGRMTTFESMGRQAGEIAAALLSGAAPASLRLPQSTQAEMHLDWNAARRWGVGERDVPPGTVWHFREPSFWESHRMAVLGAVTVFLLEAGLIAGLLFERRRRREAELAAEERRSELAHASRFAMAGELTGSIAHEINQPLGAILSNADAADLILESGGDRRDELRQILSDIRRDDVRASEVIRRLRALLAKNQVERQPFEINKAVSEIEPLLRAEARRRKVTLEIRTADGPVTLSGDPIQIQQVLIQLVLNAMDAVSGLPEPRRTVVVSVEKAPGGVSVSVRDRGNGIAPEHLSRLFDSFFTTKESGMGLGLSIARFLVEAHGGRIRAENGPGDGAVFHVAFPAARGPGVPSSEAT